MDEGEIHRKKLRDSGTRQQRPGLRLITTVESKASCGRDDDFTIRNSRNPLAAARVEVQINKKVQI